MHCDCQVNYASIYANDIGLTTTENKLNEMLNCRDHLVIERSVRVEYTKTIS